MKNLAFATLLLGLSQGALAQASSTGFGEFTCLAKNFRQNGGTDAKAEARLVFEIREKSGPLVLTKLVGHVVISREDELPAANYYSVFASKDLKQNPKYNPRVYKDSVQFQDVDEAGSSRVDGGGMNGELVIAKDRTGADFEAHYIFQTGDHMGGTLDLSCSGRW